jgi:predicted MFS family arabinose efflux permease
MTSATASAIAKGMSTPLVVLFGIAGGAAAGNLYWAQPLLATIGGDLGVSASTAGLLVTVTQIGCALGMLLIVPLGDLVNRKRMIPAIMGLSALALAASALAPTFAVLLVTLALVGVTTVAGQLLTPLAGDLAEDGQRGRVIGTVASGILLGILVARTVSGFIADPFGWRAVYVVAAVIMGIVALLMARFVPLLPQRERVSYWRLVASVFPTALKHRTARFTLVLGAAAMSVFIMFWTGLTFLLAAEPYSYSASQIGLVSIVGIAGAVTAQRVGRLFDRGLATPAIGIGLALTILALLISGLGSTTLPVLLIAIAIFSVGIQGAQVLLQTRMLSIDPAARSRLNTVFVVTNFVGGAIGSALAAVLWGLGGWTALATAAGAIIGFALVIWALQRRQTTPHA